MAALRSAARHYAPDAIPDPLFSPALAPAGHWACLWATRVLVSVGTDEVFADEDYALVQGLRRDGVSVTLIEVRGCGIRKRPSGAADCQDKHGLHEGPVTLWSPGAYERFSAGVGALLNPASGPDLAHE
jgi:acetyl esterase/lipase